MAASSAASSAAIGPESELMVVLREIAQNTADCKRKLNFMDQRVDRFFALPSDVDRHRKHIKEAQVKDEYFERDTRAARARGTWLAWCCN